MSRRCLREVSWEGVWEVSRRCPGGDLREQLRLVEEVRRQHDRPLAPHLAQQRPDGAARVRVHARGRLVEEESARAACWMAGS